MRRENEMFKKHHRMAKEERKRQNEKMSKIVLKQLNEIEGIKSSIERESVEKRRKRGEVRLISFYTTIKIVTCKYMNNNDNNNYAHRRQIKL